MDDVNRRTVESRRGDLVSRGGCLDQRLEIHAVDVNVYGAQLLERGRVRAMGGPVAALTVVQAPQRPLDALIGIVDKGNRFLSGRSLGKLYVPPTLRHVHIDRALRAPDPVVLRQRVLTAGLQAL